MDNKELFSKLILSRPYSLASIIALGFICYLLVNQKITSQIVFVGIIIVSSIIWLFSMYFGEYLHNKTNKGRSNINFFIPAILFVLLIALNYNNLTNIAILVILAFLVYVYSLKAKNTWLSPYAFIFRGSVELTVILLFLLQRISVFLEQITFVISIYLITTSRNQIGDLRDKETDKYTFVKKYGEQITKIISIVLLVLVITLNFSLLSFPLVLTLTIILFTKNYYIQHNIYVISTFFFLINFIFILLSIDIIISNLIFVGVILEYTYHFVPRESDKCWGLQ